MTARTIDALARLQRIAINLEIDLARFRRVRAECEEILRPKISQCSWCKRIRQPDGSYAVTVPEHGNITHGICPDCKRAWETGAKILKESRA